MFPPELGTIKTEIISPNFVLVKVFKLDTIRQEAYWAVVGRYCRDFKNRHDAEAYAARMESLNSVL